MRGALCSAIWMIEDPLMTLRVPALLLLTLAVAACSKQADQTATTPATPGASGAPMAAAPPPAGQEWTEVTTMTPEGGVRMGNPNAPVKLIEYASLTCPHCRDFTAEAAEPLRNSYVKTGKISWEYRPFLLNGLDTVAFLLARCQGAGPFFQLAEQTYAEQNVWEMKYFNLGQAELQKLAALEPAAQFKRTAAIAGLDGFFRARGLPQAKQDQCLGDIPAAERLVKIRDTATNDLGVNGTPTFFLNGQMVDGAPTWANLEARLKAATGA